DRLADVADDVLGEDGLVAELESERLRVLEIAAGQDATDAVHPSRRRGVDRADAGGRMRAAHGDGPEHVLGGEIASVRVRARHLGLAVDATRALSDAAARLRHAHASASSARRTASTIFW